MEFNVVRLAWNIQFGLAGELNLRRDSRKEPTGKTIHPN